MSADTDSLIEKLFDDCLRGPDNNYVVESHGAVSIVFLDSKKLKKNEVKIKTLLNQFSPNEIAENAHRDPTSEKLFQLSEAIKHHLQF